MKVKIVHASTVDFAITEAKNLLEHLKVIKESKEIEVSESNFVISDQKAVEILAEKVENGQNLDELLDDLKKELRRKIIIALIEKRRLKKRIKKEDNYCVDRERI